MDFSAKRTVQPAEHLQLGAWAQGEEASGLRLNPPDTLSLLANMNEELSMLLSHFGRRQGADRNEREQRLGFTRQIDEILQVDAPERIGKLHDAATGDSRMSAQSLLVFARQLFSDPSDLALALGELLRHWRLPEASRKRLEKARELLLEQDGEQPVRAGINAAQKCRLFGKKLGLSSQDLREAYRAFVSGQYSEVAQYAYLLEAFGFEQRHHAIDFLQETLALDISATDPSCSLEEFGTLLDRLLTLRLLRSTDRTFFASVAPQQGAPWDVAQSEQLLQLLLDSVQSAERIRQQVNELLERLLRFSRREVIARFVQQLIKGFSEIPEQVYADPTVREQLLMQLVELSGEVSGFEPGSLEALHGGY
jgi:type III secretion protein W